MAGALARTPGKAVLPGLVFWYAPWALEDHGSMSTPSTQDTLQRGNSVLIGNYARIGLVMSRGEGALLWDSDGKRYIDLFAGFGGAILGHSHTALIGAAT